MIKQKTNLWHVAIWMCGALFSFAGMALAVREALHVIPVFEILFFRSLIGIIIITAIALTRSQKLAVLRSRQINKQILRSVIHFFGQWTWVLAIGLLPLASVFAIEFTAPIWTAILAVLFLGERVTKARVLSITLGFIGVLIIIRPGINSISLGLIAALSAAIAFAGTYVLTRSLTKTDTPIAILFWMSALQLPLGLASALPTWVTPTSTTILPLLLIGLLALSAHYCLSSALQLADATLVIPFDFLRLPLIAILGYLLYDEVFDPLIIVGGLLILCGTYINLRSEKISSM